MHSTQEHESSVSPRSEMRSEAESGFLVLVVDGAITEDDARRLIAFYENHVPRGKTAFILADNRRGSSINFGARRAFSTASIGELYYAGFGGSFGFRVIANLLLKGVALVSPLHATVVSTEAEARAWLNAEKRAHEARNKES